MLFAVGLVVGAAAVAAAGWTLKVMSRSSRPRRVELPSPDNDWENEQYAEYEKGGKLRGQDVSPQDIPSA